MNNTHSIKNISWEHSLYFCICNQFFLAIKAPVSWIWSFKQNTVYFSTAAVSVNWSEICVPWLPEIESIQPIRLKHCVFVCDQMVSQWFIGLKLRLAYNKQPVHTCHATLLNNQCVKIVKASKSRTKGSECKLYNYTDSWTVHRK